MHVDSYVNPECGRATRYRILMAAETCSISNFSALALLRPRFGCWLYQDKVVTHSDGHDELHRGLGSDFKALCGLQAHWKQIKPLHVPITPEILKPLPTTGSHGSGLDLHPRHHHEACSRRRQALNGDQNGPLKEMRLLHSASTAILEIIICRILI